MGNVDEQARTAEILTRVTVAAERLGIDLHQLQPHLPRLGSAPARHARVAIDSEAERLAIQCRLADGVMPATALVRPGTTLVELETSPRTSSISEVVWAMGSRPLLEDLALLATSGVTPRAREELAARMMKLGAGRSDLLARRSEATLLRWRCGLTFGGAVPDVMQAAPPLLAIASELGIPSLQRRLLEQSLLALAAPRGFSVEFGCDAERAFPELTIAYQEVPWRQTVGLADALRPGSPCGPRLGTFAGAFGADHASALELTFRGGTAALVRVAIDVGGPAKG